jgi:hypothetical protein
VLVNSGTYILRQKAQYIGRVRANDKQQALQRAYEEFNVAEADRFRISVQRHQLGGRVATIAEPSVMSLFVRMQFGDQGLATGTGFVSQTGKGPVLITNRHNVTGRNQETDQPLSQTGGVPDRLCIVHNRKDRLGQWVERTEPLYAGQRPRWHEHPTLGAKGDFVAIPLTQLDDVGLRAYTPATPGAQIMIGVADAVSVVGFPFGLRSGGSLAVWATGFIASEPEIDHDGLPIFLIDCRSRQGQSGSAVIAYRGGGAYQESPGVSVVTNNPVWRFLGIYSGRINKESDLGIVWKASAITELLGTM